jgi:hypothetical protein|tara:strand:- start:812 stop:1000 length:189 start_codon:yes stop_codon:yes gene_type:complete
MEEVKIETTERKINHFMEELSRITRSIKLIKEGNTHVKQTGECRLEVIKKVAFNLNEDCKNM